MVYRTHSFDVM